MVLRDRLADALARRRAAMLERESLPAYLAEAPLVRRQGPDARSRRASPTLAPLPGGDRELLLAEIETETDGGDRSAGCCRWRSCGRTQTGAAARAACAGARAARPRASAC